MPATWMPGADELARWRARQIETDTAMCPTILFADNERGIRKYLKEELEAAGFQVVVVSDGVEALDVVEAMDVDLVIVDEHMPRCSGLDAAKRIKLSNPKLPVILYTADQDYQEYSSPSVNASVMKTGDLTLLKSAVVANLPSWHDATFDSGRSPISS